jgi:hypothetical protein
MIGRQALKMHQSRKVCELKRKEWALSEENPANRDDPDNLEEDRSEPMKEPMTGPPTPQEYCVSIDKSCKVDFPVLGCPGMYSTARAMRIHFRDRHTEDTIIVEQEGPYQRCQCYKMFVKKTGFKHERGYQNV